MKQNKKHLVNEKPSNSERIANFILGAFLAGFSLVVLFAGRIKYGSDATLLWASGILLLISLYPLVDSFKGVLK